MDIAILANTALTGMMGGLVYGLAAYRKKLSEKPKEKFKFCKILPTLATAAIAGVIVQFWGGELSITSLALESAGITVILEKLYKTYLKKKNKH